MYRDKYSPPCPINKIQKAYCSELKKGCHNCMQERLDKMATGSKEQGMCYTGDIFVIQKAE